MRASRKAVCARLDKLVAAGTLVYPQEVFKELSRYTDPKRYPDDLPYNWAEKNREHACRHKVPMSAVQEVTSEVPSVVDPDKPNPGEDADPYVLALALELQREGSSPTVITQDRNDTPLKMSLANACGVLAVPCLTFETFLVRTEICFRRPDDSYEISRH